jgi:hypothetical protein
MFTKTSDLFQFIGLSLFGLAVTLAAIYSIGEIHGLIIAVIILFGQSAMSFVRITALQRELTNLRQERGGTDEEVAAKV